VLAPHALRMPLWLTLLAALVMATRAAFATFGGPTTFSSAQLGPIGSSSRSQSGGANSAQSATTLGLV
jgi:hypothetical protein